MDLFFKTLGLLVILSFFLALVAVTVWEKEPEEVELEISSEVPTTATMSGVVAENRDQLIEYLQCRELLYGLKEGQPKLEIVLKDWGGSEDAVGDSVVAIYETYADIPHHSVKVDCPKSKYPIRECWFIKYEDGS